MLRIGILLSGRGRGTNFQAILNACTSGFIPGEVALVLSTTASAPALELARAAGIPARFVDPEGADDPSALDRELALQFGDAGVGLVALTGYLRLLGPEMLRRYPLRMMNIHPSLLPAFGGRGFYGHHVHEAVLQSGTRFSGATVQFVDDEYDHGPSSCSPSSPSWTTIPPSTSPPAFSSKSTPSTPRPSASSPRLDFASRAGGCGFAGTEISEKGVADWARSALECGSPMPLWFGCSVRGRRCDAHEDKGHGTAALQSAPRPVRHTLLARIYVLGFAEEGWGEAPSPERLNA